jgi:hypothetical protein
LLPGPQSTDTVPRVRIMFSAASATARPAFSINVSVAIPLAAARLSARAISALVSSSSSGTLHSRHSRRPINTQDAAGDKQSLARHPSRP